MTKRIGRNTNTYNETTGGDIVLNTSTYEVLLTENADRVGYKISNDTSSDILVNENGNDFVVPKRSFYESKTDNIFVGELTAKAVTGSPTIKVVEE